MGRRVRRKRKEDPILAYVEIIERGLKRLREVSRARGRG